VCDHLRVATPPPYPRCMCTIGGLTVDIITTAAEQPSNTTAVRVQVCAVI
jgi:hypothetical protein